MSRIIAKFKQTRTLMLASACVLVTLFASGCGSPNAKLSSNTTGTSGHAIKTVFIILMENHNWTGYAPYALKNNRNAPYINNTLVPMASHAEQYYNSPHNHPSLPNYLWLEAGTNFGIHADGTVYQYHQSTTQHLVALLDNANISWKSYEPTANSTECPFHFWHDPFVFFDDINGNLNPVSPVCLAHIRPLSELQTDLRNNTVASYNFIVPDYPDSMHLLYKGENPAIPIQTGDKWLSQVVPGILASAAYQNGGALFIAFDEAATGDGPIPMLVLSPDAKGNGYSNNIHYTHGSMLRTMEEIFGVSPMLGDAANETDLSDMFQTFP